MEFTWTLSCRSLNKRNNEKPLLLWTIREKDINFEDLEAAQIVNHFEGISGLTTKMGFCEILHDMPWICADSDEISPR